MKRASLLIVSSLAVSSLMADMAPQPQASFTPGELSTWNLDWSGIAGRSYFIQYSEDLVNWLYFPVIESGETPLSYGFESSAEKFFVRLKYTDIAAVNPEVADFDADGIPNLFELEVTGTDPFVADSDSDTVSDKDDLAPEPTSADLQVFTPLQ